MNLIENRLPQSKPFVRPIRLRSEAGVGIIAIGLFLAFFAVLPLSLFYFEMARFGLMQQELHNITDFAALSGTAALASSAQGSGIVTGQNTAMQQAVITFAQNSILQTGFGPVPTNSQLTTSTGTINNITYNLNQSTSSPAPTSTKTVVLNVTLRDQNGNLQTTGSSTAVTMAVNAQYMDSTVFASQILPIQNTVTAAAFSLGGLPQLDLILCFDVSGSMDDLSNIYLVKRYWDGSKIVNHQLTTNQGGANTPDTIYNILGPTYTGTSFNVVPPQNLSYASYPSSVYGSGGTTYTYVFTESPNNPTSYTALTGLRANTSNAPTADQTISGVTEQGCYPGNYQSSSPSSKVMSSSGVDPTSSPNYDNFFTDCICADIWANSGNQTITTSNGTFTFPSIASGGLDVAVEASRGNLESSKLYSDSLANTDPNITVTPQTGWYNAYWTQVRNLASPIATARTGAQTFFQTMNLSANAHFGLVTFSSGIGSSSTSQFYNSSDPTTTNLNIDIGPPGYTAGGTNAFPLPLVALNQSQSNYDPTNATGVTAAVLGTSTAIPLGPCRSTDIADALNEAINELTGSQTRTAAKKAIVLFTDGVPNRGTSTSTPDYGAFTSATTAGGDNIPIFTIGLSTNATIQPYETEVLGDGNESGASAPYGSQGIAYKSGNLAIYVLVTNIANLNSAFQSVARSLVVLQ